MVARRLARAGEHLRVALDTLETLGQVVEASGSSPLSSDLALRGQIRYLWIVIGSRLKEHARSFGLTRSTSSFSEPIALRDKLAYSEPARIDDSVVWTSSLFDAPTLRAEIRDALAALG